MCTPMKPQEGRTKMDRPLPQIGTVHVQYRRCGRPNCRCRRGHPHPGFYWLWRQDGRLRKRYLRSEDVEAARAACAERRRRERARREALREARELWRTLAAVLREAEAYGG
jgi:Family of unknown function (DUF6788)